MLPFLRDHDNEGAESAKRPKEPSAGGPAEEAKEQEYLTVTSRSESVRKGTYLLFALFGIGLLGLWFMIKKSTPQTAVATGAFNAEESQIDSAIARLGDTSPEMFGQAKGVVEKFYESSDVKQVPVDKLKKNPFKAERFLGGLKQIHQTEDSDSMSIAENEETADFELLAICESDKGRCCMIDDETLYQGDSIRGFKVRQIGDSFVKLQSQEMEIILEIKK